MTDQKLKALRERLQKASAKLQSEHPQILKAGNYQFTIKEARLEHDQKRKYDYLYVRLDCEGILTTDRFQITDDMFWKMGELFASIGLDIDAWSDMEDLIGRTGKLIAEAQADGKVFYRYQTAPRD